MTARAAEGFHRRSDLRSVQTQATGVTVDCVLHEQSGLWRQTAVFHCSFHRRYDAFQAFGDVAQFGDVVGALFSFAVGFSSFGDFLFNGFVWGNNQLGVEQCVIFHGDEQGFQRSRHSGELHKQLFNAMIAHVHNIHTFKGKA
ncbi:hypothetical protein D3C80_1588300 [compost metagenome]